MCEFRPATRGDYEALYDAPPPYTFTGVSGYVDGELVGMGGVARVPVNGRLVSQAFMKVIPEALSLKKDIVRGARLVKAMMEQDHHVVYAVPDPQYEQSAGFLAHWGFTPIASPQEAHRWIK